MLSPSLGTARAWSRAGLACASLQLLSIVAFAVDVESASMVALVCLTLLALAAYAAWHRALARGAPSSGHPYFLIIHVLLATWCFFLSSLTWLLHGRGFQVLEILLDADERNDLSPDARRLALGLFSILGVGLCVDAYAVAFHTRRLQGRAALTSFPLRAAGVQAAVDLAVTSVSAIALVRTRHVGFFLPVVIALLSCAVQARHALALSRAHLALDSAPFLIQCHVFGQLLSLQHALLSSVAFLTNLGLLLIVSVGGSVRSFLSALPPVSYLTLALGVVAYAGILGTSVVLVGLLSQLLADAEGGSSSGWAHEAVAFTASRGVGEEEGAWSPTTPAAVPVPLYGSGERASKPLAHAVAL